MEKEIAVASARFQQENRYVRVFAKSRRQHAPGGTATSDDIVELFHANPKQPNRYLKGSTRF